MKIAGLDMASKTGVCLGEPGQIPEFWMEDLGIGKPHDVRFGNAQRLTHKLISEHGVSLIGIEAPIKTGHDKKSTNHLLMGIIACVQGWANIKSVECELVEVAQLDKHFLGQRVLGRDNRKKANKARCWQLGWNPATEDECDAGAVFDFMCSRVSRSHAIASTPLFQGRAAV